MTASVTGLTGLRLLFLVSNSDGPCCTHRSRVRRDSLGFLRQLYRSRKISLGIASDRLVVFTRRVFRRGSPVTALALNVSRVVECDFDARSASLCGDYAYGCHMPGGEGSLSCA